MKDISVTSAFERYILYNFTIIFSFNLNSVWFITKHCIFGKLYSIYKLYSVMSVLSFLVSAKLILSARAHTQQN